MAILVLAEGRCRVYDENHHLAMFRSAGDYLFRGTRPSRTFREPYQGINVTPTSTDPIVATLFAARSRMEGEAIVIIAEKSRLATRLDGPSWITFAQIELAVNIDMTPMDFESEALKIVPIEESLRILLEMGIELPVRLPDQDALREALASSPRLGAEQIAHFARCALGDRS